MEKMPEESLLSDVKKILGDLFQRPDINAENSFLEMGGTSILAIRACARFQDQFQVKISPMELLQDLKIQDIAKLIALTQSDSILPSEKSHSIRL